MSRTIITNSGHKFYTNINSEELLGILCKISNAKYFKHDMFKNRYSLAYTMTEEEANDAAIKLNKLKDSVNEIFLQVKDFFEKGSTSDTLKKFIDDYIVDFKNSKGYYCI